VQFGVGGLVYAVGYRIDVIANPFGAPIELGWLGLPFTPLWIAGVINALNLIDGLDGLAGGVAFISLLTVFCGAAVNGYPLMMLVSAALAGAVLAFLFFNFNPASIFMGDTGSMFLGFVLATASIQAHHKASTAIALAIPVVALGIPILDTVLAMARRAARGAPLFAADRGHIHHRLLALGLSQREAVLLIYAAATVLGAAALALAAASASQALILLTGLALAILFVLRRLGYLRPENVRRLLEERQRNRKLHGGVAHAAVRLRQAAEAGDIWNTIQAAFRPRLVAQRVRERSRSRRASRRGGGARGGSALEIGGAPAA
jgi:UDP-GlcNAc:undecaprenyl-phosphate GlcNAc-1-phosphate transferase